MADNNFSDTQQCTRAFIFFNKRTWYRARKTKCSILHISLDFKPVKNKQTKKNTTKNKPKKPPAMLE